MTRCAQRNKLSSIMSAKGHRKHRNNSMARCYFYSDSYFAWYFWNTIRVTLTTIRWPDVVMTYRQKRAFQLLFLSFLSASRLACLCVALATPYILNAFFAYFQSAFVILARCSAGNRDFQKRTQSCVSRVSSRRAIFLNFICRCQKFELSTITRVMAADARFSEREDDTTYFLYSKNMKMLR